MPSKMPSAHSASSLDIPAGAAPARVTGLYFASIQHQYSCKCVDCSVTQLSDLITATKKANTSGHSQMLGALQTAGCTAVAPDKVFRYNNTLYLSRWNQYERLCKDKAKYQLIHSTDRGTNRRHYCYHPAGATRSSGRKAKTRYDPYSTRAKKQRLRT